MALIPAVGQLVAEGVVVLLSGLAAITTAVLLGRMLRWWGFDGLARKKDE